MQDVISWEVADKLVADDYFYTMHRFNDANQRVSPYIKSYPKHMAFNISLGVNDVSKKEFTDLCEQGTIPTSVNIDVAHGHHKKVKDMIRWIQNGYYLKQPYIIAGNVATADGYKYLCDLGVDAIKVGIGGGSICSTRYKTGFYLPTAYSVWECSHKGERDIPIIADGGAIHFGDVAKALVLGADMVMSGRWFAECIDSPARIRDGKKIYRGSTSFESKGHNRHIEGHTLSITEGCTYAERLQEIQEALQSAISYAGGKDLSAFNNVDWDLLR